MVVGSWHFSQVQYERIKAKVKRKYIKNIRPKVGSHVHFADTQYPKICWLERF